MITKSENAIYYFSNGFNCSQAVLASFGQEYGVSGDECLKLACAFGGGIARRQMTCGAVTGALMVLGLKFGWGRNDDISKKTATYEKANEFIEEFTERNGSINCRELLRGLDMNDPEDQKMIEKLELFQTICVKYIRDAVEIAQRMTMMD
jgi:C_GCAxxG_C_C family probable redox protein